MIKNNDYYIIENEEDLKNPIICYCVMMKFIKETGEDYIDYNESIVRPVPFITWMNGKGYITNEQLDQLLDIDGLYLQEVSYKLFPNTYGQGIFSEAKFYQLLVKYISCIKGLRQRVYDSVNDKADYFENGEFYKNEDEISLACIIPIEELMIGVHDTSNPRDQRETFNWTFTEMYYKVKDMTIKECDVELEY